MVVCQSRHFSVDDNTVCMAFITRAVSVKYHMYLGIKILERQWFYVFDEYLRYPFCLAMISFFCLAIP